MRRHHKIYGDHHQLVLYYRKICTQNEYNSVCLRVNTWMYKAANVSKFSQSSRQPRQTRHKDMYTVRHTIKVRKNQQFPAPLCTGGHTDEGVRLYRLMTSTCTER